MSKRTTFTTISPLPPSITRQVVIDFLHNHLEMIDLNPLVIERHPIDPPPHATPDEVRCIWYSLTDKISYLPGGLADGDVTYTCAFHDLPHGIQTHCYAPAGLNIQSKWTLNGSLPGEPIEPVELGINAPLSGLYIREDVDMRCNVIMASFVKKTLKKSHAVLIDRLKAKAQMVTAAEFNPRGSIQISSPAMSTQSKNSRPWTPSTSSIHSDNSQPRTSSTSVHSAASVPPSGPTNIPLSLHPGRTSIPIFPPYQPSSCATPPPNPATNFHSQQYPPPYQHQLSQPQSHSQRHAEQSLHFSAPLNKYPPPSQNDSPANIPNSNLYPDALRLSRMDSVSSAYPDENDHAPWQTLKTGPSVRYREGHPDYPQMNPYTGGGKAQHSGAAAPAPVPEPTTMGGTLNGPFMAELE